jgi:protein SCO1/2
MGGLPGPRALLVPAVVGLLVLAAVGYVGWSRSQAQALEDFGEAPAWSLTDQFDRPLSADSLRGKAIVADFIFTNCPDVCPLLSLQMKKLQQRLRQEQLLGTRVQLVSFTTDPARDTPAVLRAYAEQFEAEPQGWSFVTGPEAELTTVLEKGFRVPMQRVPLARPALEAHDHGAAGGAGYSVIHTSRFVLIDPQGRVRGWYDGLDFDPERIVRDVRRVS